MHIKSIEIKNWRSIKYIKIDAKKLMMVIGQNNHGKSNLLSAILFFFGEIKQHQDSDFYFETEELFVEVEFTNLDDVEKGTFEQYLTPYENIIVRKTAYKSGEYIYKGKIAEPEELYLREIHAKDYTDREKAIKLPFYDALPQKGNITIKSVIEGQKKYMEENGDKINLNYEFSVTNFFGAKPVAKGMLGEVYFIPAVKEAADDFASKDSSAFGKIIAQIIGAMASASEVSNAWEATEDKLSKLFESLNKSDSKGNINNDRPPELNVIEARLNDKLSKWAAKVEIEVTPPNIDVAVKGNTKIFIDDGYKTDISRKGHGLQRRLILAMAEIIAENSKNEPEKSEKKSTRKASKSSYLIFEEPELYLHPQAQRLLLESLIFLSNNGFQVILSTHSSAFIDLERYDSIYIATKDLETGTEIKNCNENIFDDVDEQEKKEFNNLAYYINPDRGELFFAKKVILVEGQTDKVVLRELAEKLGIFKHEYTIIDCASKNNIHLYIKLLNKFEIKYVAVFDKDHQTGKNENEKIMAAKSTKKILDSIESKFGSSVIFENDIEKELGMEKEDKKGSKPLSALNFIKNKGGVIPKQLEQKIRDIYS